MLPKFTSVFLIGCFIVIAALYGDGAEASVASSTRAYNGCMAFLKMSPAKQLQVSRRTPHTLQQNLNACRLLKKTGLARMIFLDGQYTQWEKDQAAWERANRSNRDDDQTDSVVPYKSSAGVSGTCYSAPGCNGSSSMTSSRINCPGSTSSFHPDVGGTCESY